jgi:hypothetical protein
LVQRTQIRNCWTTQGTPTILKALGVDPNTLKSVQKEKTELLPDLPFLAKSIPLSGDNLRGAKVPAFVMQAG